jgi:hypothetical protein
MQNKLYWGLTEDELEDFFLSNKYRNEEHFYEFPCTNEKIEGRYILCCGECENCIERYKIEKETNKECYYYLEKVRQQEPDFDRAMLYRIPEIFPELKKNKEENIIIDKNEKTLHIKIPFKLLPEFLNNYKGLVKLEIINQEEEDDEEILINKKKKIISPEHKQKLLQNLQKARQERFKKYKEQQEELAREEEQKEKAREEKLNKYKEEQEEKLKKNKKFTNDELYKDNYWYR